MNELAAHTYSLSRARTRVREQQLFWAATSAVAVALAAVLALLVTRWPAHEDEALVLFLGREPFADLLQTVVTERGGAPLHFALGWIVVHVDGGLTELRLISSAFAVASIPLIAVLGRRLAGPAVGVVSTVLASASWALLFHGVYGRMYTLFLFTSVLSFIALLSALDDGDGRRFTLWGLALVAVLASHPYALLVVAAQLLYVLLRRVRVRESLLTLAVVALVATPFWWADVVLRDRFDVGVGGGGARLGSSDEVFVYLWRVAGDFSIGAGAWSVVALLVAAAGVVLLARRRGDAVLLTGCVVGVPAAVLTLATLGSTTSPESRHLIYVLPFFSLLLAIPVVAVARVRPPVTAAFAAIGVLLLVAGGVRWAHEKTPLLFEGDPSAVRHARAAAATWLASTHRPNDVLLGYEPVYLAAWTRDRSFGRHVLPRADPALLAEDLRDVPLPIGRGVWVLDAHDSTNAEQRETIALALPQPAREFEARVFGPYLVIRSRDELVTTRRYVTISKRIMRVGQRLQIGDADINLAALNEAASHL